MRKRVGQHCHDCRSKLRLERGPQVHCFGKWSFKVVEGQIIEKHYKDLFQNVHFSNNHTTYGPECPHAIGTDGKEMWENGAWSMTWQVKGGEPVNGKGFHSSIAVLEDGVWKKRMLTDNATPAPAK